MKTRSNNAAVLLSTERISATHTALEHTEKVLNVVCSEAVFVHVLIAPMQHGFMIRNFFAYFAVEVAFIGYQR